MEKKITISILTLIIMLTLTACNITDYKNAMELYNSGNYQEALAAFDKLADYKDSSEMVTKCKYETAKSLFSSGNFKEAYMILSKMREYEDCTELINQCVAGLILQTEDLAAQETMDYLLSLEGTLTYEDMETILLYLISENQDTAVAIHTLAKLQTPENYKKVISHLSSALFNRIDKGSDIMESAASSLNDFVDEFSSYIVSMIFSGAESFTLDYYDFASYKEISNYAGKLSDERSYILTNYPSDDLQIIDVELSEACISYLDALNIFNSYIQGNIYVQDVINEVSSGSSLLNKNLAEITSKLGALETAANNLKNNNIE